MAAFRLLDQNAQYRLASGAVAAGGELRFYTTATTTPKDVYGGPLLNPNLGATVTLDSAGRVENDVWLNGIYRVRLYDADAALVWSLDDVQNGATGGILPLNPAAGTEGQVYFTDGADAYWGNVREVPDPTGSSGKYLGTDGTAVSWTSFPTAVTYGTTNLPGGITQGATYVQIGKLLIQFGSDTAATAAAEYTTDAVTFPTAYATLLHVECSPTGSSGFTGRGTGATQQIAGSVSGFTVRFSCGNEHGASDYNITTAITYTWVAFGLVA